MVASIASDSPKVGSAHQKRASSGIDSNVVIRTLREHPGAMKTFGENLIFQLNRLDNGPEDLCVALLILKVRASERPADQRRFCTFFSPRRAQSTFYTSTMPVSWSISSFASSSTCQTRARACVCSATRLTDAASAYLPSSSSSAPEQHSATYLSVQAAPDTPRP